jgi:hypothetical protein
MATHAARIQASNPPASNESPRYPIGSRRQVHSRVRDFAGNLMIPAAAPADDGRLDKAARFIVAPGAIDPPARKGQLIGSASILAQNLNRFVGGRLVISIEFRQSLSACSHCKISMNQNVPQVTRILELQIWQHWFKDVASTSSS